MAEDSVVELARLMQNAALDPAQWAPALDAVNTFVGCNGVVLLSVEARQRFAPMSSDLGEMIDDYFALGWYLNDRREVCLPLLKANGIVFDHEFQTVEEIENCDFYRDFLARHRRKWFAGVSVGIDGDDWCLSLQRSPEKGPFGPQDKARLEVLRGMLANTSVLSRRIGRSWISGLRHALDVMGQAAILFDSHARILHVNDAAATSIGSSIDKERTIRFGSVQATAAFHEMLGSALLSSDGRAASEPVRIIQIGSESYHCRATCLLGHEGLIATSAAVLVVLKPVAKSPSRLMMERYALTKTEATVAIALADGRSVKEIAADRCVRADTIRANLKSVYAKTEITRQSQLVAFVRSLAADGVGGLRAA